MFSLNLHSALLHLRRLVLLLLAGSASCLARAQAPAIEVWDYHVFEPFFISPDEGLSRDLVGLLERECGGRYQFHYIATSRPRVNRHLEGVDRGILLWANPDWFPALANSPDYQWTLPVLRDANDLLSPARTPIDYRGPQSLYGKKLGVVRSWYITPLETHFSNGSITRNDAAELHHNLARLIAGRVDVALLPRSTARFLVRDWQLQDQVHVSVPPLIWFDRRLLLSGFTDEPELLVQLNAAIRRLQAGQEWQDLLRRHNLDAR